MFFRAQNIFVSVKPTTAMMYRNANPCNCLRSQVSDKAVMSSNGVRYPKGVRWEKYIFRTDAIMAEFWNLPCKVRFIVCITGGGFTPCAANVKLIVTGNSRYFAKMYIANLFRWSSAQKQGSSLHLREPEPGNIRPVVRKGTIFREPLLVVALVSESLAREPECVVFMLDAARPEVGLLPWVGPVLSIFRPFF